MHPAPRLACCFAILATPACTVTLDATEASSAASMASSMRTTVTYTGVRDAQRFADYSAIDRRIVVKR